MSPKRKAADCRLSGMERAFFDLQRDAKVWGAEGQNKNKQSPEVPSIKRDWCFSDLSTASITEILTGPNPGIGGQSPKLQ